MLDSKIAQRVSTPSHKSTAIKKHSKRERYTPVACNECKAHKVKCSGDLACRRCVKHSVHCVYERLLPPYKLQSSIMASDKEDIQHKLSRMQASLDYFLQNISTVTSPGIPAYKPMGAEELSGRFLPCMEYIPSRRNSDAHDDNNSNNSTISSSTDCSFDNLPGLSHTAQSLQSQDLSMTFDMNSASRVVYCRQSLWPLTKDEAFVLFERFRDDCEKLYQFIEFQDMETLLHTVYDQFPGKETISDSKSTNWRTPNDGGNIDLLKIILACALATGEKRDVKIGREFMNAVEENNCRKLRGSGINVKDLAVATILSVYHCLSNEILLAWRKIGSVARICLELGLHKTSAATDENTRSGEDPWASKMFGCIHLLDRQYSFITKLPFTFRDEDIDPKLPLPMSASNLIHEKSPTINLGQTPAGYPANGEPWMALRVT